MSTVTTAVARLPPSSTAPKSSKSASSSVTPTASVNRKSSKLETSENSELSRSNSNRSDSSSPNQPFRSRSCKLKDQSNVNQVGEAAEPTPTRVSWKTSKLFSRTLSSIEVIRAMKSKQQQELQQQQSQPAQQSQQSHPMNRSPSPTKPAVIVTATGDSNISTSILSSGRSEIRSPIRAERASPEPEVISPGSGEGGRRGIFKAASEWKTLKNKLSALRRKSGPGSNSGNQDEITDDNDDETRLDRRSSNSRQSNSGSARTSRSGSQDEGIVCKREDLINLLTEATKVSPPKIRSDPPSGGSPTAGPRKVYLKTSSSSTVQITEDPSRKLAKKSALKKNPSSEVKTVQTSTTSVTSTEETSDFIETKIVVPQIKPTLKFDLSHEKESRNRSATTSRSTKGIQFRETEVKSEASGGNIAVSSVITTDKPIESKEKTLSPSSEAASTRTIEKKIQIDPQPKSEVVGPVAVDDSKPVAAVQWDESNVVDAMMLGDAIQAFLRGMGSTPAQTEKRVLFKKNS